MSEILFLYPSGLRSKMGSTEPYYIIEKMSDDHKVHIFSRSDPGISGTTFYKIDCPEIIPAMIWHNLLILPMYIYYVLRISPDYIYSYKGYQLTPYILQMIFSIEWVADFRTAPVEQARERAVSQCDASVVRLAYIDMQSLLYKLTLPACGTVITLSDRLAQLLNESYGVARDRLRIIPLGVDTAKFTPNNESFEGDTIQVVYTGSIRTIREMDTCIRAVGIAQKNGVPVRLHLVGGGDEDYIQSLKSLAEEVGVTDAVEWHGYVDHEEIPEIMAKMDVGLSHLPDREMYRVSSPTKVFEYLATGLPVICSDIKPHRRILQSGSTGFFYKPNHPEELAEKIQQISDMSRDEIKNCSVDAREASIEHDWKKRMEVIDEIIK